jgi:hypothetical protein
LLCFPQEFQGHGFASGVSGSAEEFRCLLVDDDGFVELTRVHECAAEREQRVALTLVVADLLADRESFLMTGRLSAGRFRLKRAWTTLNRALTS